MSQWKISTTAAADRGGVSPGSKFRSPPRSSGAMGSHRRKHVVVKATAFGIAAIAVGGTMNAVGLTPNGTALGESSLEAAANQMTLGSGFHFVDQTEATKQVAVPQAQAMRESMSQLVKIEDDVEFLEAAQQYLQSEFGVVIPFAFGARILLPDPACIPLDELKADSWQVIDADGESRELLGRSGIWIIDRTDPDLLPRQVNAFWSDGDLVVLKEEDQLFLYSPRQRAFARYRTTFPSADD